jgi:hypothetical protein
LLEKPGHIEVAGWMSDPGGSCKQLPSRQRSP